MRSRRPVLAGLAAVASGGAIGAAGRWALRASSADSLGSVEWATLATNVVGAFLVAGIARTLARGSLPWLFAVTGVLGGFTTFSAFAVETQQLMAEDRVAVAAVYVVATLSLGAAAHALASGGGASRS